MGSQTLRSKINSLIKFGSCFVYDQEDDIPTRVISTTRMRSGQMKFGPSTVERFIRIGVLLIFRVLAICVFFVLALTAIALVYSCILVIALATLPLLLISLLITRTFQFFKYGDEYKKLTHFKYYIRGWLYIDVGIVLLALWTFFPIAKFVPSINQVTLLNLPLTKWIEIISIVCGFYLVSYLMYMLIHRVTRFLKVRSGLKVAQAVSEIIDGLIFWWAEHEVMKRVPSFKSHEIFGVPTRKWLRVSILMLIGYDLITLFTHIAVMSLRHICQQHPHVTHKSFWKNVLVEHLHKEYIAYFANGMKFSISFIMSSLLLLLTWVLYFGSRLDMKISETKSMWEFGFWTLIALLICSVFWLIKTFVLLAWEAHTVYQRLEHKIISISKQLYFLGILNCDKHDIFRLKYKNENKDDDKQESSTSETSRSPRGAIDQILTDFFDLSPKGANKKLNIRKKKRINTDLLMHDKPTMDDLQQASRYFLAAKSRLMKETYVSDLLGLFHQTNDNRKKLKEIIDDHEENHFQGDIVMKPMNQSTRSGEDDVGEEDKQESIEQSSSSNCGTQRNDWDHFVELLEQPDNNSLISFKHIQAWVERAYSQCTYLANTLSSADEVAGCLNKIIGWLMIAAMFIMWLLLTGLATTKVLVLIASPLLAATFIFGNACKTLFEGVLFVYVVHPLDVGDLCVIDNDMMEVRAIGILTSTFEKVDEIGTKEVVIYPNLELANKVIINHKTKFDWSDSVELALGYFNTTNIGHEYIVNFFKDHVEKMASSSNLKVSVMDNSIKLFVRLTYKIENTKDWTYSKCLVQKNKLQAEFYILMQGVIRQFKDEQKENELANEDQ